jgi:hypothetical protein
MGVPTKTSTISPSDWFVLWISTQGDYRGVSYTDLLAEIQADITIGRPEEDTQYAAPNTDPFSIQIQDDNKDVHLILTPLAGGDNGTLTFPLNTKCRDKQEITVNITAALTTLAIAANGATAVTGVPVGATAIDAFFKWKYDLATNSWYRVG